MIAHPNLHRPRVLVIDDEEMIRRMALTVLEDDYDVHAAASMEEGVKSFLEQRPDVVVLDICMPGCDGLQGLKHLRSLDATVSMVMMTGHGSLESAKRALALGVHDYMEKPFDAKTLQHTVRCASERTRVMRREQERVEEMTGIIRELSGQLQQRRVEERAAAGGTHLIGDLQHALRASLAYTDRLAADASAPDRAGGEDGPLRLWREHTALLCKLVGLCVAPKREGALGGPVRDRLEALLNDLAQRAAGVGVSLDWRVRIGDGEVTGSVPDLLQAVECLLMSRVLAGPRSSAPLRVACSEGRDVLEIRVEDHAGTGVRGTADDQPSGGTAPSADAAEAGLALVNDLVARRGGRLSIDTAPGRCTLISVRIPLESPVPAAVG